MSAGQRRAMPAATAQLAGQMLAQIAEGLETHRPEEAVTPTSRIAIIQATTMDATLGGALRELAPEVDPEDLPTRRAYAAQLRKIAGAS